MALQDRRKNMFMKPQPKPWPVPSPIPAWASPGRPLPGIVTGPEGGGREPRRCQGPVPRLVEDCGGGRAKEPGLRARGGGEGRGPAPGDGWRGRASVRWVWEAGARMGVGQGLGCVITEFAICWMVFLRIPCVFVRPQGRCWPRGYPYGSGNSDPTRSGLFGIIRSHRPGDSVSGLGCQFGDIFLILGVHMI